MTNQEAFNKVWDHFVVKKNGPSVDGSGTCKYRGRNGTKCAIGVLIPDEAYEPQMDYGGLKLERIISMYPKFREALKGVGRDFLCDLQATHDMFTRGRRILQFHTLIRAELQQVAKRWNLAIPS